MRKVGVFTAYQPKIKLGNDGIGRLMAYIISGMVSNEDEVTILVPSWHKFEVYELLKEHQLDQKVHVHSVKHHGPILFELYNILSSFRNKNIPHQKISLNWKKAAKNALYSILASYSVCCFLLYAALLLTTSILFFPIFIICFLAEKCSRIEIPLITKFKNHYLTALPRHLRNDELVLGIMTAARRYELSRMIDFVNKSAIDYWYIPSVFWKETSEITKKKITIVPDLVYAEFSHLYYSDPVMVWTGNNIDKFLQTDIQIACYSNYVAERHLVQLRNIMPEKISVIPHALLDLSKHLREGLTADEIIKNFLHTYWANLPQWKYLKNFSLTDGTFLIYSSQFRYHKNIFFLLHVLNTLIKREHLNLKLILTCANYAPLITLLHELNLEREVLILPQVPEFVLAALNAKAVLSINPSLFEGGFPFTFGEAYSVGVPSVMADIPVTREYVNGALAEKMLFDPYNEENAVAKIKWALRNRKELLDLEQPLFDYLRKRSWGDVAEEYIAAMKKSVPPQKDKRRKRKTWKR